MLIWSYGASCAHVSVFGVRTLANWPQIISQHTCRWLASSKVISSPQFEKPRSHLAQPLTLSIFHTNIFHPQIGNTREHAAPMNTNYLVFLFGERRFRSMFLYRRKVIEKVNCTAPAITSAINFIIYYYYYFPI